MGYSKITTVELINFMSFKKAKVTFDETGIINLKGYNDSGKSTIERAMAVCLMDMFKRKQLKFIRHGEDFFRVVISFDDGVSILRDKYSNGQSLYELYRGGELVYTTKQGNKLGKVDGVPEIIQDYLGLCPIENGYLNYQSCVDKLPVVDNTGSENYQMFHEVLKLEEIYRANAMINADKNELGSRISEIEYAISRDEVLLNDCGDVTQDFIDEVQKLEDTSKETNDKKCLLDTVKEAEQGYSRIKDIPEIKMIPTKRYGSLLKIKEDFGKYSSIRELPVVDKVSTKRLETVLGIAKAYSIVSKDDSIPAIKKIDTNKEKLLISVVKEFKGYAKASNSCKELNNALEKARKSLDEIISKASEQGMQFTKCKNCGSYVVVGGEHNHE